MLTSYVSVRVRTALDFGQHTVNYYSIDGMNVVSLLSFYVLNESLICYVLISIDIHVQYGQAHKIEVLFA